MIMVLLNPIWFVIRSIERHIGHSKMYIDKYCFKHMIMGTVERVYGHFNILEASRTGRGLFRCKL